MGAPGPGRLESALGQLWALANIAPENFVAIILQNKSHLYLQVILNKCLVDIFFDFEGNPMGDLGLLKL